MTYVQGLKKQHKLLILCLQTKGNDRRIPNHSFVSSEKEVIRNHCHLLSVGSTGGSVVLGFLVFFSAGFEAFAEEASAIKTNSKMQILFKDQ